MVIGQTETFRGMGDGTGKEFAHESCYWRSLYNQEKDKNYLLSTTIDQLKIDLIRERYITDVCRNHILETKELLNEYK